MLSFSRILFSEYFITVSYINMRDKLSNLGSLPRFISRKLSDQMSQLGAPSAQPVEPRLFVVFSDALSRRNVVFPAFRQFSVV